MKLRKKKERNPINSKYKPKTKPKPKPKNNPMNFDPVTLKPTLFNYN